MTYTIRYLGSHLPYTYHVHTCMGPNACQTFGTLGPNACIVSVFGFVIESLSTAADSSLLPIVTLPVVTVGSSNRPVLHTTF